MNDSDYDYYYGRILGDIVSAIAGGAEIGTGIGTVISSFLVGGAVTIGSGGTLTVTGVGVLSAGTAEWTVLIGVGVNTVTVASAGFYNDYNKLIELGKTEYKKTISGSSKKKATDVPSWAKGHAPFKGESGKDFAKRLCDEKFGVGNYPTGPKSDYNKIKKWGDRNFK